MTDFAARLPSNNMILRRIDGVLYQAVTYTLPEQVIDLGRHGKSSIVRVKDHPTRPARSTDFNFWWEIVPPQRPKGIRHGR